MLNLLLRFVIAGSIVVGVTELSRRSPRIGALLLTLTAHNTRPTYELEKNCGAGSGFAMKLGPRFLKSFSSGANCALIFSRDQSPIAPQDTCVGPTAS